jgi:LmbE family N-acetylglucosaminyl deacetylase
MEKLQTVLALGAHPDDIELGCGATLAKLADNGVEIHAAIFTEGDRGTIVPAQRAEETRQALELIGVSRCHQFAFADTRLHEQLNELIGVIGNLVETVRPDRVYTMFDHDRHQDHRAVYEASIVACRSVRQILGYETPSSYPNFLPTYFEAIEPFVDRKVEALRLHCSQESRVYMQEVKIRSAAHFRGAQIDVGQAEGFIPYKLVF